MQPVTAAMLETPVPEWGAPTAAPARRGTLLDIFAATALRWSDRVAIDAEVALTYGELAKSARDLAGRLRALGVGPGDRIGVRVSSGTAELYVAILGILESGAAYVPVDADDPPARAAELLERARVCAVVRDGLAIDPVGPVGGARRPPTPDDDAWVIFTSGSTGTPKGVAITHGAAAAFVDAEAELFQLDVSDRVLAGLSVSFDASCEEIWLAWRHGAALVPARRAIVRAGADLGPWLVEHEITVVSTVPTLAAMWQEDDLRGVRLLILGGEACPEGLAWRLAERREVWNTYGPTEATVVTTAARIKPEEPVTIGWPLQGWEVAVVDRDGEPVPIGEAGELVIGGVGLGRYLDAALDAERFAGLPSFGWERAYRTGDIVRETVSGLQFVGRRDDQVKLGGRRVELGEIDAQLTAAPGVLAAAAAMRETTVGNKLLVGYVVGDVDATAVRAWLGRRLPAPLVPLIVQLDSLPRGLSGKVDRRALPWPPPSLPSDPSLGESASVAWLAERWADQLGPLPLTVDSDFFELGGSSLAAAKLVSALRTRFPAVAVSDVYNHRRLGELAARLDQLGSVDEREPVRHPSGRRGWGAVRLAGALAVLSFTGLQWLFGVLAVNWFYPGLVGPRLALGWLIAGCLVFVSAPGRVGVLVLARTALLRRLRPGRFPRDSWLCWRISVAERLAEVCRIESLAGTPWAWRYARLCGHPLGRGARLGTLPPVTSLVSIGEGATLEADVDIHGWWIEGDELVIGEVRIGEGARIGTRTLLMPGADIGAGAEIEPGSVVAGTVPAGQRWAGSPASHVGEAGESWPTTAAPAPRRAGLWKAMFGVGLTIQSFLALAAAVPGIVVVVPLVASSWSAQSIATAAIVVAPALAASFLIAYGLLVALLVRVVSPLIRPGWHADHGAVGWALWFTELLMAGSRGVLFPLYSTIYVRPWLCLLGIRVGRRAEVSTAVGLSRLTRFGDASFATDDVVFGTARARGGWLHVAPIEVGNHSFLGNGAILEGSTKVGDRSLVGVLTTPPRSSGDETSWFGCPALELPRRPDQPDPSRTTNPPCRLILARAAMELIRILLPGTVSVALGAVALWALETIGTTRGLAAMAASAPFVLLAAGVCAALVTIAVKWLLIGRYRVGDHPLWSFFVWRDEIVNTCQEQLAGVWLLHTALTTPLMSVYLRLMGAKVGRDVWCETMTITEFDLVRLGDGCAINRFSVVETHLFHDRLMRLGPATLGAESTLGPSSALLPDTELGAGCSVAGRSVVMRGERLPARTRWHGAPVVAV